MTAKSSLDDLRTILVVIDPDAERQMTLDRVRYLTQKTDIAVTLVAADYTQYLVEGYYFSEVELPALRAQYMQERAELLQAIAQPLRDEGISVDCEAIWAHPPYEGILTAIKKYKPDLVMRHMAHHAAISRMALSHDDWQLVRHCPCPLLLVKDKPWNDKLVMLAGVDPLHARGKPSGLDHKILAAGQLLESRLDAELYVAHAFRSIPLSGLYPGDAQDAHRAAFDELTQQFAIPVSHQMFLEETPEYALSKLGGDIDADIVILGAVSRTLLQDIFIGNTTEKVLDFLECDALLLRPDLN